MNNAASLLTTALLGLVLGGCGPRTMVFLANRDVTVSGDLTHIRHTEHGDAVHGKLRIQGSSGELRSADLDCFTLSIGTRRSESVWVDSLVDHAKGDWPAHDGVVTVNLYWAMPDDLKLTDGDLGKATLGVETPDGRTSCFEFTS